MANNLSSADQQLPADQQAEILKLKEQYAQYQASGNTDGMKAAHKAAEDIRASAGYTGGKDGSGYSLLPNQSGNRPQQNTNVAGMPADEVQKWVDDYWYTNYNKDKGWTNGFSGQMNMRSMANYIRQQMEANSQAWNTADAATRDYLHQQNVALASILRDATGGTESTYDPATGKWSTANANLGYGTNVGQYDDLDWYKNFYGMTDDQINAYRNDTGRYRNYVDQNLIRNWIDEGSGYTGVYSQFVNGPYLSLLTGDNPSRVNPNVYTDVQGDGFNEHDYEPLRDADGNIVPRSPALKNNNGMTDYTRQFASYVDENGVIQPGSLLRTNPAGGRSSGSNGSYSGNTDGDGAGAAQYLAYLASMRNQNAAGSAGMSGEETSGGASSGAGSASGSGASGGSYFSGISAPSTGGDLSGYINQIYDASLRAQLAQLEAAYQENLLELDRNQTETDDQYNEQKRQTQGDAERSAANWRELAVAQGLNTGAVGQAALAQNNQLQSDLNTLSTAQAKALDDIRNQRTLLGKQYQLQIMQAQADNDMERAQALYQEAVRMDEALREKEAQAMSMMQTLLSNASYGSSGASAGGSGSSGSGGGGSYGGSYGSSSGSSSYSAPMLGTDAFNQYLREQANLNGQSASDYIYANYKALGIPYSQIGNYVNSYNTWDDANRMSNSEFAMYLYTLQQLAKANQTERVYSQIEQNMNKLSASQQAQVEAFLNQWGKG